LLIIGLCRTKFANFIGSWARRRWKRRFSKRPSNTPQGQKNNCGCRRRRRRTVPDEDRGRGNRRLPLQSCGLSTGTVQETDRSAPATGRLTGVQDQGGRRRAADLQLLRRRRHPQLRPRHRARTEDDASRKSTEQRNGSEYFSKLVLKLIRRAECPKYCLLTAPARYVHQNAVK